MAQYLEILSGERQVVLMSDARISIGSAPSNDVVLDDRQVSRLHAAIEPYSGGWAVRDLGSRNGTYVNADRIVQERALRPGDEIRLGSSRIIFRTADRDGMPSTETADAPPMLTRRETEVLIELCRPVLSQDLFTEPATVKDIAARLVVSEGAIKHHLSNLFDKFLITEGDRRRIRLANEAIRRGAVSIADLR